MGDLNSVDINWESWSTNYKEGSKENKFIKTIRGCYLHQHLQLLPTCGCVNDEPLLIDLLLTDEIMQVSDITHHTPLGNNVHVQPLPNVFKTKGTV